MILSADNLIEKRFSVKELEEAKYLAFSQTALINEVNAAQTCGVFCSIVLPDLTNLQANYDFNNAYYRMKNKEGDKLFYLNLANKEIVEIKIDSNKLKDFDKKITKIARKESYNPHNIENIFLHYEKELSFYKSTGASCVTALTATEQAIITSITGIRTLQYKDLHTVILRFNGLCELISNFVVMEEAT
ncbi:MAG: hypothetical protein QM652_00700 [Legionella sp.]|uniref:hypothetical protein n=1 Tax=Legionella sp. TaxID=459 RepID=UPI0039E32EB4